MIIQKPFPGPIGSAILTFIGYKQTDRQTDKPNFFIDRNKLVWIKYRTFELENSSIMIYERKQS